MKRERGESLFLAYGSPICVSFITSQRLIFSAPLWENESHGLRVLSYTDCSKILNLIR